MKKKLIIIGLCILLLLSIGANYRLSLSTLLEYKEECLLYDYKPYEVTEYFCDSKYRYLMICDENRNKGVSYNKWEIDCNCPNIENRTVTLFNKTDVCLKYHLVKITQTPKGVNENG